MTLSLADAQVEPEEPGGAADASPFARLFSRRRLLIYASLALVVFTALSVFKLTGGEGVRNRAGEPIGGDFIAFWVASSIVQDGTPGAVYDKNQMLAREETLMKGPSPTFPWLYPPTFLLVVSGLASLPYLAGLVLWLTTTAAAAFLTLRRLLTQPVLWLLALSFPAVVQNASSGQTGFLSAALMGSGLMLLQTRPVLAGAALGLLSFKPHFLPLVVLALLVSRRWSTLVAIGASAAVLALASLMVFGPGTWLQFFRHLTETSSLIFDGLVPWNRMTTVTGAGLMAGAPFLVVNLLQASVSLASAAVVVRVWRGNAQPVLRNAVLCFCVLLATPYAFDYDMIILGLGLLWLGLECQATGWRRWERECIAFGWCMPLAAPRIALSTDIGLSPVMLGVLVWVTVRRIRADAVALQRPASELHQEAA